MYTQTHMLLQQWYTQYGRHTLPWRNTDDIYKIYVSEIMLQQTQVQRVMEEYYPKFLDRFATLHELAQACEAEVLQLWSGLGYYSRARNLHKTAQIVQTTLPTTQKELLALPGIGRYTASAICCFGDHQNIPVVDTNIARVLKRFFALQNPSEKLLWEYARNFVDATRPRDHNLALMDLGSLICRVKDPLCQECPLYDVCQGRTNPHWYTQSKKTASIAMDLFLGVSLVNNTIAMHYSKDGMYKNMLVLPNVDPLEEEYIGAFNHAYTKYRLRVKLYAKKEIEGEDIVWINLDDEEKLPISSLTKKALQIIKNYSSLV